MDQRTYNRFVKPYIEDFRDEIDNNKFDNLLWAAAEDTCEDCVFSFLYDDVGINPLPFIERPLPPEVFTYYSDVTKSRELVIPKNIATDNFNVLFKCCTYDTVTFEVLDKFEEEMFKGAKTSVIKVLATSHKKFFFSDNSFVGVPINGLKVYLPRDVKSVELEEFVDYNSLGDVEIYIPKYAIWKVVDTDDTVSTEHISNMIRRYD